MRMNFKIKNFSQFSQFTFIQESQSFSLWFKRCQNLTIVTILTQDAKEVLQSATSRKWLRTDVRQIIG